MRLILIKLKSGSPYDFVKAVHRAVFWYTGAIGIVVIRHTASNDYLITTRGSYLRREIKDVFHEDLFTRDDEVIVTIGGEKGSKAHSYTVMTAPMSFESRYGSLYPSMSGNIFVTSDVDFKEFPSTEYETSLSKYAREFVLSDKVKSLVIKGDFENVINQNPETHGGMKIVFGNKDGIYIHNAHRFLGKSGILISDKEKGIKILKFLEYTNYGKSKPKSVPATTEWRPDNFRNREFFKEIDELIYYVNNAELASKKPFKNLEKFILVDPNSYPNMELMSLRTGKVDGLILYSLMHNYTPYRIPKLHDKRKS